MICILFHSYFIKKYILLLMPFSLLLRVNFFIFFIFNQYVMKFLYEVLWVRECLKMIIYMYIFRESIGRTHKLENTVHQTYITCLLYIYSFFFLFSLLFHARWTHGECHLQTNRFYSKKSLALIIT